MSLLIFVHHPNEGPCVLGQVLQDYGHRLRTVELFAGQSVPPDLDDVNGVISLGGPMNTDQAALFPWMKPEMDFLKAAHAAGTPILGICLGAQLITVALGGEVKPMPTPPGAEIGWHTVRQSFAGNTDTLHQGIAWNSPQLHLHGQEITKLPPEATALSGSKTCRIQALRVGLKTYGFQYHFEWDRRDIQTAAAGSFVKACGHTAESILAELDTHFDTYRRLSDRLCQNIATYLFPAGVK